MADRQLSPIDHFLGAIDGSLRTLNHDAKSSGRAYPAEVAPEGIENDVERKHAAGLMRINHTGEICAQALYEGQAMMTHDPKIRDLLKHAAAEEGDHLKWCERRLKELDSAPSKLDPFFYGGAFLMGAFASFTGDKWNMGFLSETERQVEAHLASHLDILPKEDARSRAIVEQMKIDEAEHAQMAEDNGAKPLPKFVISMMHSAAKAMKFITYRV